MIGLLALASCASHSVMPRKGPGSGTLRVRVAGIQPTHGQMRIALFASEDGFPIDANKAERIDSLPVTGPEVEWVADHVATGKWAVVVLHDEDEDGRMKTDWLGRPREGWGVSNGDQHRSGLPRFDESAVEVGEDRTDLLIKLRY
jgi:uncharacterized protein (DUF2141 family)